MFMLGCEGVKMESCYVYVFLY